MTIAIQAELAEKQLKELEQLFENKISNEKEVMQKQFEKDQLKNV